MILLSFLILRFCHRLYSLIKMLLGECSEILFYIYKSILLAKDVVQRLRSLAYLQQILGHSLTPYFGHQRNTKFDPQVLAGVCLILKRQISCPGICEMLTDFS